MRRRRPDSRTVSASSDAHTPEACGLGSELARSGLDVAATLDVAAYEQCVPSAWRAAELLPGARSAIVVGAGGRALHERFSALGRPRGLALDDYAAEAIEHGCRALRAAGHAARAFGYEARQGGVHVDLVALARRAGLGAPSRLGLLIHPRYGPWLSLRFLVLSARPVPAASAPPAFDPCAGCAAPCSQACPAAAPRALPAGFDVASCADERGRSSACRLRCAARRACVVGPEHAYSDEAEALHMEASLAATLMRR